MSNTLIIMKYQKNKKKLENIDRENRINNVDGKYF